MSDYTVADFMDVINGISLLEEACHEHPQIPNLYFLAAPAAYDPGETNFDAVRSMFDEIRNTFEYCFVDSPSGISEGFKLAHSGADMSIIVTNGELPAIRDAQRAADAARSMGVNELRLLVNRVLPANFKRMHTTIDDVIDCIGARLLGVIREDNSIFLALHENVPLVLYEKRRAIYDFLDAARRLAGEEIPLRFRR